MVAVVVLNFNKFLRMRDQSHTKFQMYYEETDEAFKMYIIIPGTVFYTKVLKKELGQENDEMKLLGETEIEREYKIYAFKRTYLNDGIQIEKFLLPEMKEFDVEKKEEEVPIQEMEELEDNQSTVSDKLE